MAQPSRRALNDCEEEFDFEPEIEACKMGVREGVGVGEHNVELMRSEGDLHDDVDENVREIYGAFQDSHSSSARFANHIGPKLRDLEEDLGYKVNATPGAVSGEITDAYYHGVGEQIEAEVEEELGDNRHRV